MTGGGAAVPAGAPPEVARARRWGVAGPLAVPALLVVVAVLQQPGRVTFDTDLALALDPGHLLRRSLHLWSAESGFGGVGDQTYGYLFPLGPFFWLGHHLALPAWLVQRLWCALVLVLAYEGARRLVRRMISPLPVVAVVAGLAWALSPRMVTTVGAFSSEALTVALTPWLLLPLVCHLARDVRRAAWLSGLVVLGLGAANAGATVAVLPVPLLYLLTRETPWRDRLRCTGWWSAGVLLASAWWIGPLLLFGAYSPPFTDWVESARTTTDPVSGLSALRGTTDWVAFVPHYWPAGWSLVSSRGLFVATTAVAVLGLAGLAARRLPERRFLVTTALFGFALLTLGHAGSPGSPLAEPFRALLDGPAVPFRNIYKLDPVLRLPLVLGLAHLLARLLTRSWRVPLLRPVGAVVVAVLVGACALPAVQGTLRPGPGFRDLPTWWSAAAGYLADQPERGRTLLVPAATGGRYTWGRTIGEPLEVLARTPWAVRGQVPLTAAGNTRLVDAVEGVLESGRGSPALADVLARSGVSRLLVRNDLDRRTADTLPPVRVRQALERSPGLRRVAAFGPPQVPGGDAVDGGIDIAPPALEVWSVDRPVERVRTSPLSEAAVVAGGPEDLVALLEQGLVGAEQPTVLAGQLDGQLDGGSWSGPRVVTDGLQRRERSFGRVHHALGPLLTATEPYRQERPAHDLLPFDATGLQTVAAYDGLTAVTSSSSAASSNSFGVARSESDASAALDGDPSTAWSSVGYLAPVGQWLQIERTSSSDVATIGLTLVSRPLFGPAVTSVRLETDAGSVLHRVTPSESRTLLTLPVGPWRRLRVTVAGVAGGARAGAVGIRELDVPDLQPRRTAVATGRLPDGPQAPALLLRAADPTSPCVVVDGSQRCDPASATSGDEPSVLDRTFTLAQPADLALTGSVLPQQGPGLARLLTPLGDGLTAEASSSLDTGPVGAHAAVDGDGRTAWLASPLDLRPALTLRWGRAVTLDRVVLVPADQPRASAPTVVRVHSTNGDRVAPVGADGLVRFAPLRTRSLTLTFPGVEVAASTSSQTLLTAALPVGLAEVRVPQAPAPVRLRPGDATGAFCGFGPVVELDGRSYPTQVRGTVGDLLASRPLALEACGAGGTPVPLTAGRHRVRVAATAEFRVRSLALAPSDLPAPTGAPGRAVAVGEWGQVRRTVTVAPGSAALLVVPEAANAGWRAELGGRVLRPVTVDGWQQGWVVPDGAGGEVELSFGPDRLYRRLLLLGGAAVLLLLLLAGRAASRPDRDGPAEGAARAAVSRPRGTGALALAVGSWAVGGPVCLAALLAAAVVVRLGRRSWVAATCWAAPLAAGVVVALQTSEPVYVVQSGRTAQVLSLVAVGALAALLLPHRLRRARPERRG